MFDIALDKRNELGCKLGTIANILKGSTSLPEEDKERQSYKGQWEFIYWL